MTSNQHTIEELEMLRGLINSSVDLVEEIVLCNNDPPLSLRTLKEHPIYRRHDPTTSYALKTISSASQMLRALCDPNRFLNDVTYGYQDETALLIACQADIPNILGDIACHVDELASKTGINADRLGRFLRNLCNCHIFEEIAPNKFANNALSVKFQSEAKRAIVGHCVDECRFASCRAWEALTLPEYKDATDTNKAPFNIAYDTTMDYFAYTSTIRTDIGNRTKKAMAGKGFNLGQYLNLYPWASEKNAHIVDVGGGIGAATMPIVRAFPNLRLTVQDMEDSAAEFKRVITYRKTIPTSRNMAEYSLLR
ncbi:hypothetical protein BDV59DRAFT_204136 [Aspergillus ambiguus]|uniref:uncharacterized protein n=1 Tax=Aspergillus ambiguus TaxID=176160 RepID=UPI003CCCC25F